MPIIDSVAAVFCHETKLFSVRRQLHLEAFPGYDSFPGGKIDATDSTDRFELPLLRDWDGREMHALVREIGEELAYDLPAGIHSGQITAINYLATALAPATLPVRFRIHFYRIDLSTRPEFTPDQGELAETCWISARELLDRFDRGESLMVPPLRRMLERLAIDGRGHSFGDLSPCFNEEQFVPRMELLSGLTILPVPSRTFPPLKRTNAFLLGDDDTPKVLVDPSPESPQVLARLLRTLQRERIDALLLTHHHPDHHELAPQLAAHLRVPILLSKETRHLILRRYGTDYFSSVPLKILRQGDNLTRWKGEKVIVHAIPGHDVGQLGLAPESRRWFIVGDLIQVTGTVVIAAPEGDMATYFNTLEKLIELDPAVIIPSHGIPLRSTFRLRAALLHRRKRERDILTLYHQGNAPERILDLLYREVDPRLLPLAEKNIESHLRKLHQEGRLDSTGTVSERKQRGES